MRFALMLMVLFCAATVAQADDVTVVDAPVVVPDAAPVVPDNVEQPADALVVVAPPVEVPPESPPITVEVEPEPSVEVTVSSAEPGGAVTVAVETESEPWTWTGIGWQLAGYVVPVLGALLTALVGFGIQWLRAKTASLRWQSVLYQLEDTVDTAVAAVQQVTVDALKKAAVDGKLTDEEKAAAFAEALAQVKLILGTQGLATMQAALQAGQEVIEAFLRVKIEAAVAAQKVMP